MSEFNLDPQRVHDLIAGMRDLLRESMAVHGAGPLRSYEMIAACAFMAALQIEASPEASKLRRWFMERFEESEVAARAINKRLDLQYIMGGENG